MSKTDADETLRDIATGRVPDWVGDHLRAYVESNGKEGHLIDATPFGGKGMTPCLLLTTIGRKSGEKRTSPLIYGADGDAYVIVGSKAGSETHAAWYLNLQANPEVEIQVGEEKFTARARVAIGAERERLWAKMVDVYPPYVDYQAKTSRRIPIVVLERASGRLDRS